jgi:tungstate transport system substrate-binding protein
MGDENDPPKRADVTRRDVLLLSTSSVIAAGAAACAKPSSPAPGAAAAAEPPTIPPAASHVVRVASVPTAVEGNLLPTLIAAFEKQSPYRIELTSHDDIYALARTGFADLAISHYGHKHAESFVMDGYGEWPRTLFSNQMALLGPPEDPAKVRGLVDVGEAFRRIAATKSLFVVNHIDGVRYLTEVLWNAAGRPDRAGWLVDEGRRKDDAIAYASEKRAYSLWGLTPFLRWSRETATKAGPDLHLEPLVLADPLLQRMLVSIVVKPSKVPAVNAAGATAFQTFLLSPATQARIREVRYPGAEGVLWVPAGRHNRTGMLPMG